MFTAPMRVLPYPLNRASALEVENPAQEGICEVPEFPEDSDEKITVLFRLSLNEFVAIASAVDVGSDIAYGDDGQKVWWLWIANLMCASFCGEVAQCFTDQNEALMIAVAEAIASNPLLQAAIASAISEQGGAVPGRPLTESQANQDTLPPEVRDEEGNCIEDALWGACLFLVQSANRAITDFFELLEGASNSIETSAIVAGAVPAAGAYASAALEFADQLQENLSEGYAAAYTSDYENDLACAIFCRALSECDLTMDMLVDVINNRLPDPEDVSNFGLVMARIGSGTFVFSEVADAMMYIYFTAIRFGQQFLDVFGVRPLTDLMSLGADQLATNNWQILCNCPGTWEYEADLTALASWTADTDFSDYGTFYPGLGWGAGPVQPRSNLFGIVFDEPTELLYVEYEWDTPMTGNLRRAYLEDRPSYSFALTIEPLDGVIAGFTDIGTVPGLTIGGYNDTNTAVTMPGYVFRVFVRGRGYQPPQLGG